MVKLPTMGTSENILHITWTLFLLAFCYPLPAGTSISPLSVMRAAKCVIPNGAEHITRAALLQQCISINYAQGNETLCYPELGCFPMDEPWTSLIRPLPSPLHPAEINTRLYCYSRDSSEKHFITLWPEISLEGCPFQASKQSVFITHGFASTGNSSWLTEMKDNYLTMVNATVFLVDWGNGAQFFNYLQVASNTRIVGAELARFIKYLQAKHDLDPENVHLIGHSLGAQASGYTAKRVPHVGRLTALDPAQPGFEGANRAVRLDKSDADYVEVVHTNGAPFLPTLGFGLMLPAGHVDFYMNGGIRQPGCVLPDVTEIKSIGDLAKFPVEVVNKWVSCSHGRAYEYFTESLLNNCTLWGHLASLTQRALSAATLGVIDPVVSKVKTCDADSCTSLGLNTPRLPARGVFIVPTPSNKPFCDDPEVNSRILEEIAEALTRKKNELEKTTHKIESVVIETSNNANRVAKEAHNSTVAAVKETADDTQAAAKGSVDIIATALNGTADKTKAAFKGSADNIVNVGRRLDSVRNVFG